MAELAAIRTAVRQEMERALDKLSPAEEPVELKLARERPVALHAFYVGDGKWQLARWECSTRQWVNLPASALVRTESAS